MKVDYRMCPWKNELLLELSRKKRKSLFDRINACVGSKIQGQNFTVPEKEIAC